MAKIPKLQSQEIQSQVKLASPAIGISPRLTDIGAGKELQMAGEAVSKLSNQFEKIITDNQITKADTAARRQLRELELEAETGDIDIKTYTDRIKKIKEDVSAGISLPRAKNEFQSAYNNTALISEFNIKRTLNVRHIDQSLATLNENLEIMGNNYINGSAKEQAFTLYDMKFKIDQRVNDGIITKVKGEKLKSDILNGWQEAQVYNKLFSNPAETLAELKRGNEGIYHYLPDKERLTYINKASIIVENLDKERRRAEREAMITNRFDSIGKVVSGEIDLKNSPELIRGMYGKDFDLAEAMEKNALEGGYELTDESNRAFHDAAVNVFKSGTTKEITDFLIRALGGSHEISRDRLATLLYAAQKRADELNKGEEKGFWNNLTEIMRQSVTGEIYQTLINTLTRAKKEDATNERVEEIANEEIRKERIKRYPWIISLPKEGERRKFPDGVIRKVYPDGRIEDK